VVDPARDCEGTSHHGEDRRPKRLWNTTNPPTSNRGADFTRKIDQGTFGLQAHDPGSVVYYKNIRVKRL
jgi:hypothetical protein